MRRAHIVSMTGFATLAVGASSLAHHSISRHFHSDQSVTVEGVIVEVLLRNPHSQIRMSVGDVSGHAELWVLELDDIGDLAKQGIVENTLRAGDEIVVVGHPSREAPNSLFVRTLHRPDDGLDYEED